MQEFTTHTFKDAPYAPVEYTQPLTYPFDSDGPAVIRFVDKYVTTPDGKPLHLDDFQKALLCHILERYPSEGSRRGSLRFRQAVVSMGRQNGKSTLASILSLYGLYLHSAGPRVVGVASTQRQAGIVYDNTYRIIKNNTGLFKLIKPTATRGLKKRDLSGGYETVAAKGDALQGLPVTLGVADELHIMKPEVWDSILMGQRAQAKSLLIGITTAGDDTSLLLKRLYDQGREAINSPVDDNERFGFFLWEAPEGSTIMDDDALKAANPSVMCGRISVNQARNDVLNVPVQDQERYGLNRFTAAISGWLPVRDWLKLGEDDIKPRENNLIFSVDKYGNMDHVTFTVSKKDKEGVIHTRLIKTLNNPKHQQIVDICKYLNKFHSGCTFVFDSKTLNAVAKELKQKGFNVVILYPANVAEACSLTFSLIKHKRIRHNHHPFMTSQVPRGKRKNFGDSWAISRSESIGRVDSLMSMVMGVYIAETKPAKPLQIF